MAEQQILRLGCNGLTTDPGPFAGVPDGAMVEAQNVIFRRPGVAEPRRRSSSLATDRTGSCYGAFAFDDGTNVTPQWIGSSGWRAGGTTTVSGGFTFSQYKTQHSSYRGRGFFTSDQGIAVLDGASDTSARLRAFRGAFQRIIYAPATATPVGWLNAGYGVSYRTVIRSNGRNDPPRGSSLLGFDVVNDTGVAEQVVYAAVLPDARYHRWRLPRDLPNANVGGYDVTNGYGTFYDDNPADEGRYETRCLSTASTSPPDTSIGRTKSPMGLGPGHTSTNASQDGILLANERPNYCVDVASYNRMQFFGGSAARSASPRNFTGSRRLLRSTPMERHRRPTYRDSRAF